MRAVVPRSVTSTVPRCGRQNDLPLSALPRLSVRPAGTGTAPWQPARAVPDGEAEGVAPDGVPLGEGTPDEGADAEVTPAVPCCCPHATVIAEAPMATAAARTGTLRTPASFHGGNPPVTMSSCVLTTLDAGRAGCGSPRMSGIG